MFWKKKEPEVHYQYQWVVDEHDYILSVVDIRKRKPTSFNVGQKVKFYSYVRKQTYYVQVTDHYFNEYENMVYIRVKHIDREEFEKIFDGMRRLMNEVF